MIGNSFNLGKIAIASLSLIGLLGLFPKIAQSQEDRFDNQTIFFTIDTIIEFEFLQSNGVYQSTFGVINLDTGEKTPLLQEVKPADSFESVDRPSNYEENLSTTDISDFKGTPGNTVPQPLSEFLFKANTPYMFYLESFYEGRPVGTVYSANANNLASNQQFLFDGDFFNLGDGGILLRIDDTGSALVKKDQQDTDFDDFVIGIGGHLACPVAQGDSSFRVSQGEKQAPSLISCRF